MAVSVCCESATVPMNWGSFLAGISPAGRAVASIGLVVVVLALLTTPGRRLRTSGRPQE